MVETMYFLTEEERRWVLKGLAPRARANGVAEELRGWNWPNPPLASPGDGVRLSVSEVASRYCPNGRDVYLRRVAHAKAVATGEMAAGSFYHAVVTSTMVLAKSLIYTCGVAGAAEVVRRLRALGEDGLPWEVGLEVPQTPAMQTFEQSQAGGQRRPAAPSADVEVNARALASFEGGRLAARLEQALASQPYIGADALANSVVPVVTEQRLDGSFLGLSRHLSTDALFLGEPMVVDVKFGRPEDFHRLTTAGYALVLESLHEYPVDLGCIVYCQFKGGRPVVQRELHLIDDEVRQWFIEERDQKLAMVRDQWDPGIPSGCRASCQFAVECGSQGVSEGTPDAAAAGARPKVKAKAKAVKTPSEKAVASA
jgi:CRISPR-associated protein Csa1